MKSFTIAASAALLLNLFSTPAAAACVQTDLKGKFRVYDVWIENGGFVGWSYCTVKVGATGSLVSGTPCKDKELGESLLSFKISGGSLKLASNCRITGTIRTSDGGVVTIRDGWLSKTGDSIAGVGTYSGGIIQFNGVRM